MLTILYLHRFLLQNHVIPDICAQISHPYGTSNGPTAVVVWACLCCVVAVLIKLPFIPRIFSLNGIKKLKETKKKPLLGIIRGVEVRAVSIGLTYRVFPGSASGHTYESTGKSRY